jgi:hypothetical protein
MRDLLLYTIVEQSDCKSNSYFYIERCRPSTLWWQGCGASLAVTSSSRLSKDGQSLARLTGKLVDTAEVRRKSVERQGRSIGG